MATRIEFEPNDLLEAVDRAIQRQLQRFGDLVARDAAESLEIRHRPSLPGETPSIWSSELADIRAAVNRRDGAVTIGVVPTSSSGGDVPSVLEAGGIGADGSSREPRPFLQPALRRQIDRQQPGIWRDSVS